MLASGLSGFYFAIFLVLWTLILRGVSIEFRSHLEDPLWRPCVGLPVLRGERAAARPVRRRARQPRCAACRSARTAGSRSPLFTDFTARPPVGILDWYTVLAGVFALLAIGGHGAHVPGVEDRRRGAGAEPARRGWLYGAVAVLWPLLTLATMHVNRRDVRRVAAPAAGMAVGAGGRWRG